MATAEELLERAHEHAESAEGFLSDAEFREDPEIQQIRYLQVVSHATLAVYLQNQVLLEAIREQGGLSGLEAG